MTHIQDALEHNLYAGQTFFKYKIDEIFIWYA